MFVILSGKQKVVKRGWLVVQLLYSHIPEFSVAMFPLERDAMLGLNRTHKCYNWACMHGCGHRHGESRTCGC